MGGINIKKEQEEFENQLDEQEKLEFKARLKEQNDSIDDEQLKIMYIYIFSKNTISKEFKELICEPESLGNEILNGIEIIKASNKDRKNWIFYFIENGNEEKLKVISQDFKNKDSVFVCLSQSLSSPEINLILTNFSKIFLKYQPFYLFLTETEPDIKIIIDKISSYPKMDKRNFFAMKYDKINQDIYINFYKYISKFYSYYNELGDTLILEDENNTFISRFNILVCGRAGVGKSTFINNILNEKRCREGSGQSVTKKITFYNLLKYPITLYDTPGFENEKTVSNVVETLKKKNNDFKNMKQSIHLILYLVRYGDRTFLDYEKPVLSKLSIFNAKMLFVVTKSPFKLDNEEFEEFQDTLCEDIKEMFNNVDSKIIELLFGKNFSNLLNNIFPVNLKKEKKEDEEFGLDILFDKCYECFNKEKIPHQILSNLKNGDEKTIEEILGKYMLFKYYKSRKDIILAAKKNAMQKIIKFSFYSSIGSYLPSFGSSKNFERLLLAMVSSLAKVYARNLSKDEAKLLVKNVLDHKENIVNNYKTNSWKDTIIILVSIPCSFICWPMGLGCFLFCGSIYYYNTYKFGVEESENFAKQLENSIPLYLFFLSLHFNLGIESLYTLKEKYYKMYNNAAPIVKNG